MADLRIGPDTATSAERAAVDAVIAPVGPAVVAESERLVRGGPTRRRERRHLLLPALHALQHEIGWISPGGLNHVADVLQVPPAEAYGVATFYELLGTSDPGSAEDLHHVCVDPACRIAGAEEMAAELEASGHRVHRGPCLGQCDRAPALFVQGVGRPDHVPVDDEPWSLPQAGQGSVRVLRRVGVVDPGSLESHLSHGGHEALRQAIGMGPAEVRRLVTDAGLWGRGGAAFPTGIKWTAVAEAPGPRKHVVANCDESEPGTFKDRVLLEHDPFSLIEAMTIAAFATGATQGWIYVRGEYPRATERLADAIGQCRAAGLLGDDASGIGGRFDVELRRGAGAYICGEETALFASIEGFRGEPRSKPPFPTTHGLFGEPTAVNNPETLLNVITIVGEGVDAYRSLGTGESPGTRLFCLSGAVARPGVYELPFGTTLGVALDAAGGVVGRLKAILLGGAAGAFIGPDQLGLRLTLEDTRAAGVGLGSGAITVFGEEVDLADIVVRIAEFFRNESCGQCVPCRVGTVRQHELLAGLHRGIAIEPGRVELIDDIARAMADASICGLGHSAAGAVRSAIELGLFGRAP